MSILLFSIMPPVTNQYGRRYHPFSRPLALHILFPVERLTCPPHSLYTIHPSDSDVSSINQPQPLLSKAGILTTAAEYFTMQERQYPNKIYEKPKGDVGHTDSRRGYSLVATLKWPTEVYKEVQVGYSSHSLCIFSSIMLRLQCAGSLANSYPWLHSGIRHLATWIPFIRTYAILFFQYLRIFSLRSTGSWYLSIPAKLCSELGHRGFPPHVSQE